MSSFKSLPIVDLKKLDDAATRQDTLDQIRSALFEVGFLYIVNHGVEEQAEKIMAIAPKAFDVSESEKLKCAMSNKPHFVGYTKLGAEMTAKKTDIREQFDFGSATGPDPNAVFPDAPQWRKLQGPSMYLPDSVLPGFEQTVKDYIEAMDKLSTRFLQVAADSLNVPPDTFTQFEGAMNRLKIVKYPASENPDESTQGVGPHKDSSGMITYVLQDSVGGLEVLNSDGEWIAATPIPGSLVVNIAQGFEALTGGRCTATSHRVVSPPAGVVRYSIPYFQGVKLDLTLSQINEQLRSISGKIPEPKDVKRREVAVPSEFLDPKYSCVSVVLMTSLKLSLIC
jgi:isopenicillin N synthase-like dioxygenase